MALYSEEQIAIANRVNLEEYLRSHGERLKRTGNEYKWIYSDHQGEHDSIAVRDNKWYDHKSGTGGYTVSFLQEFYGMTFPAAMNNLLSGEMPKLCQVSTSNVKQEYAKTKFVLPPKANNVKRLFAYLIKKRFISSDVVKLFVEQKLMYQEAKHGNIVFVGMDEKGIPVSACQKSVSDKFAHFKNTVAGSDMNYGFSFQGEGDKLFVFEAAVDMLSYITVFPDNWKENSYLALDGLSPKAMLRFVETHSNIKEIDICIDYDTAGIEANDKFKDLLIEKGYEPNRIIRIMPTFKDWNEMLKEQNGIVPIFPQFHPKIEDYGRVIRQLGIINAKGESPYTIWKQQGMDKGGMGFLIERVDAETKSLHKSVNVQEESSNIYESCAVKIADLALTALSRLRMQEGDLLPQPTIYCNIAKELWTEYKPYQDKMKIGRRYEELEKETGNVMKKFHEQDPSLFCCLKKLAESAIRLKVYMDIDYQQELERVQRLQNNAGEQTEGENICQSNLYL